MSNDKCPACSRKLIQHPEFNVLACSVCSREFIRIYKRWSIIKYYEERIKKGLGNQPNPHKIEKSRSTFKP